ncbi:hypothetical protein [Polycyclovorans algicola]|uniref:hypothetical protein n=1 Tax=Polycyclovorans algicola TaxID=616992 RepID=UPI0004A74FED|nr:hypothetical protein [Polycyclovorans algicola]
MADKRSTLRERVRQLWRGVSGDGAADPFDQQRVTLEIPGPDGTPLFKLELHSEVTPEADGEHLHLRTRMQTNFASVLRPMLAAAEAGRPALTHRPGMEGGRGLRLAHRVSAGVQTVAQRALQVPLLRNVAESAMAHDVNTYIDLEATTSSLIDGSRALAHHAAQPALRRLGIVADESPDAPPLQTWAGEVGDGFAQVSLLRLDERHFSAALKQALGGRPLKIAATLVNTVERPPQPRKRR